MEKRFTKPDRETLYHYRLDAVVGQGGTGKVYRAIDTNTGEVVAVKLFFARFFRNKMHLKDFTRNAKKFKEFNHPNLTRIFDFICGDEGNCLIQEYVDGVNLKWYLDNRPFNLKERLVILAQICNGLQYIHDRGYVHHDFKPGNVLFTRRGQVKVSDFSLLCGPKSLLRFIDSGAPEQVTPMYIAPELVRHKKPTPKCDIYSLGVTCYFMFTGKFPYEGHTAQRLYELHRVTDPLHPTLIDRKCPQELGDVIMKMMRKNPADRFESCDQIRIRIAEIGRSRI